MGNSTSNYRKTSSVSRTLVGNKIVDNSDVGGGGGGGGGGTTGFFWVQASVSKTSLEDWSL